MTRKPTIHHTGFSKTELVIILMIIVGLFAMLYPAVQQARNPNGSHGDMYPTAAPDEANRVSHPKGLSIITPENWDQLQHTESETPTLRIAARGAPGRRLRSVIAVGQCDPKPDQQILDRCKKTLFQQRRAYEIYQILREETFDDPARSSYDLYVEHKGTWWHINFLVADRMTVLPDSIRQYIETVKFPDTE